MLVEFGRTTMLRYVNSAYSYLFYVNGVYVVKEHLLMIIDMN